MGRRTCTPYSASTLSLCATVCQLFYSTCYGANWGEYLSLPLSLSLPLYLCTIDMLNISDHTGVTLYIKYIYIQWNRLSRG